MQPAAHREGGSSRDAGAADSRDSPARRLRDGIDYPRGKVQKPMRIAAFSLPALLCVLAGCGSSAPVKTESPFIAPNSLMADEIDSRIENIPYQHREELLLSLQWLSQQGEQAIPALLQGLSSTDAKTRSSCAWTLGRIGDRRVIPQLQKCTNDESETVRLEIARQLLMMGDYTTAPTLIEGLDSDRKEVRYLCHEALKSATGRDFGYDHLSEDAHARATAAYGWRTWWSEYCGDPFFAQNYARQHGLQGLAAPMGEVKNPPATTPNGQDNKGTPPNQVPMDTPKVEAPAPKNAGDALQPVMPAAPAKPVLPPQNGDGR